MRSSAGYGLPCNRERLDDEDQLAVKFEDYPDPDKYADDFFFGYFVRRARRIARRSARKSAARSFTFKRDSVLRMNLAKGLEPYRHNAVFTQSPLTARRTARTRTREIGPAAPGDRRDRLPVPVRPEPARTAGRSSTGLQAAEGNRRAERRRRQPRPQLLRDGPGEHRDPAHHLARRRLQDLRFPAKRDPREEQSQQYVFPEVIDGILHDPPDYPGKEFYLGGKIVKDMPAEQAKKLAKRA